MTKMASLITVDMNKSPEVSKLPVKSETLISLLSCPTDYHSSINETTGKDINERTRCEWYQKAANQ